MLFDRIGQNFRSGDEETAGLLSICFDEEDRMLRSGELNSDFAFGVFVK
jgi:hypothetical protein